MMQEVESFERWSGAPGEQKPNRRIALGFLCAAVGALGGALVWAAITSTTEREFGMIAWAIGGLAGAGALLGGLGGGLTFQVIGAGWALIGVLAAKYFTVAMVVSKMASEEGVEVGWFAPEMWQAFTLTFSSLFSPFDLLWIALAVGTAWKIPGNNQPQAD